MTADKPLRVAGTAVVLRDGAEGPEVLLLQRPAAGSFPGAWVFPGGKVDPADEHDAADECEAARRAAVRETQEEAGIRISGPVLLSRWTPPAETPVRFRTWFFLAREFGDTVVTNEGEIERAVWATPRRALAAHAQGEGTLFPPTWLTLHQLRSSGTVDEVFATVGEPVYFSTRMARTEQGQLALWAGDELHDTEPGEPGARNRLLMGALPWQYQRSAAEAG